MQYVGNGNGTTPSLPGAKPKEYLSLLYRGKWILLVTTLLGITVMWIQTAMTPPTYESKAMVLINQRQGQGFNPFADVADRREEKLANELAVLKTRTLAVKVGEALLNHPRLDSASGKFMSIVLKNPEDTASGLTGSRTIAGRLQKAVRFVPEKESDVINIVVGRPNPLEAAVVASTFAHEYRDQVLMQSRSRSRSVREFLEGRLGEQRGQLAVTENSLKKYMETSGVVSLDGESNRVVTELSTLEGKRNALAIEIESLRRKITALEKELGQQGAVAPSVTAQADDAYIRRLQDQIAGYEIQRDLMITKNDPAVLNQEENKNRLKEIDSQLAALRSKLEKRTSDLVNSFLGSNTGTGQGDAVGNIRTLKTALVESRIQLEGLLTQQKPLKEAIAQYEGRFSRIPRQSIEFARLQRERLGAERLYTLVEEKYNESAITEKSEFGNVDIIEEPEPSFVPVSPVLSMNLLLGLVIGLGVGIAVIVVKDLVDLRVQSPEQLKRHGYVSLAEVGRFEKEFKTMPKNAPMPTGTEKLDKALWLTFNPLSFLAESYRRLRSSLVRLSLERPMKVISITSPNPGEGKSTTIANLAISLAESQQRVLLIDADLRRPSVQKLFGLPPTLGLADVLTRAATVTEATQHKVLPNLDVMPAGNATKAPSVVFGSPEMAALFTDLRETYDWVLVDAPPILLVNDGAVLASLSDGCIMTVNAGVTRIEALDRSSEHIAAAGGRILGLVINRFDPKFAYGAYYGGTRYGHYDASHGYGEKQEA